MDKYKLDPIEDILDQVNDIFNKYPEDRIYKHLHLLFQYIRFEYYLKHGIIAKARMILGNIDSQIPNLLIHYETFTYPPQLLVGKLELYLDDHIGVNEISNTNSFEDFNINSCGKSAKVIYYIYRALSSYYVKDYTDASKWLFELNNEVSFKEHHYLLLELKCMTAYIKYLQHDLTLFKQNLTSAQRTLRIIGAENTPHLAVFIKLLSVLNSDRKKNRAAKLKEHVQSLKQYKLSGFQPTLYIKPDLEYLLKKVY